MNQPRNEENLLFETQSTERPPQHTGINDRESQGSPHLLAQDTVHSSSIMCRNDSCQSNSRVDCRPMTHDGALLEECLHAKQRLAWTAPPRILEYLAESMTRQSNPQPQPPIKELQAQIRVLQEQMAERDRELQVLREENQGLREANQRIQQQSEHRLRNFAMMSHEIRTPLNGMIGLTSLLQANGDDLTPEQAAAVDMIAVSGDLLLRVVNDVLDYTKLTVGMVDISKEETLLHPLLRQAVDASRVKAQQRGINIQMSLAKNLPLYVFTDGKRLSQILLNLLGNAVKFSDDGGVIELNVFRGVTKSGNPSLRIDIKDYGMGIEKENFAKIFDPFQQANAETEKSYGGTGLGLTISSQLAKALGGDISVDSEFGKWCLFSVEFELNEESSTDTNDDSIEVYSDCNISVSSASTLSDFSSRRASDKSQRSTSARTKLNMEERRLDEFRVLVAEDNHINQMLVDRMLRRFGVKHIEIVGDGCAAVKRCNETSYDLILMDWSMPKMDGIDATRLIRNCCQNSNADTKIIFVTAHAMEGYKAKAIKAGGNGFLQKPFKFDDLKHIMESTMKSGL